MNSTEAVKRIFSLQHTEIYRKKRNWNCRRKRKSFPNDKKKKRLDYNMLLLLLSALELWLCDRDTLIMIYVSWLYSINIILFSTKKQTFYQWLRRTWNSILLAHLICAPITIIISNECKKSKREKWFGGRRSKDERFGLNW